MYADHVPVINGAMRADLDTFKRGVMFAILSARVQFHRVPAQAQELKERGAKAGCLWGFKLGAYLHLEEHGFTIYEWACRATTPYECMMALTSIPGLGINKAGFVCQMLGHDIACLDARNIEREGRKTRAYTAHHKTSARYPELVKDYIAETLGRSEALWNTWCHEVGPDYGMTAEACSLLHVTTIVPKHLRKSWQAVTKMEPIPF